MLQLVRSVGGSVGKWGAIIVAGGRSVRMGRPKAFLPWRGEALLRSVARTVAHRCPTTLVVASPGQPLPWLPPSVLRIDDPPGRAHRGPMAGVLTGLTALAATDCDAAFLTSSDAVATTSTHIAFIQSLLEASSTDVQAVAPVSRENDRRIVHGLSSAVRIAPALDAVLRLTSSDRWALKDLFEILPTRSVEAERLPDPEALRAPNTPQTWDAHRRRHGD